MHLFLCRSKYYLSLSRVGRRVILKKRKSSAPADSFKAEMISLLLYRSSIATAGLKALTFTVDSEKPSTEHMPDIFSPTTEFQNLRARLLDESLFNSWRDHKLSTRIRTLFIYIKRDQEVLPALQESSNLYRNPVLLL